MGFAADWLAQGICALAVLFAVALIGVWRRVPVWHHQTANTPNPHSPRVIASSGIMRILAARTLAFVNYGGVVAIKRCGQTMDDRVAGRYAVRRRQTFWINLTTLVVLAVGRG